MVVSKVKTMELSESRSFWSFQGKEEWLQATLRAKKELTKENISYTSDTGKNYDFYTADTLNTLLLNCMFASGQLKEGEMYDVDFDLYGWNSLSL